MPLPAAHFESPSAPGPKPSALSLLRRLGPLTLWAIALGVFVLTVLIPYSTSKVRFVCLLSFAAVWIGLIAFLWKRKGWRWLLPGATVAAAVFLLLPGRPFSRDTLRDNYAVCLQRYEGVMYFWGGEGATGIDCSGLVRRGLIDALLQEGFRTMNPGAVREALSLWWNDTTARDLGEAQGATREVTATPTINGLDHTRIRPGDLAVTKSGVHIMAYIGNQVWIEADPAAGRVITLKAPSSGNVWLATPMNIVRWRMLE